MHSDTKWQKKYSIYFINQIVILISVMNVCRRVSATKLAFFLQNTQKKNKGP